MDILDGVLCVVVEIAKVVIVIYAAVGFVIFFIRRYF
mgnify:CR=1 FL=1